MSVKLGDQKMYQDMACFYPNSMAEAADGALCQPLPPPAPPEQLRYLSFNPEAEGGGDTFAPTMMDFQLQHHYLSFNTHFIQDSSNHQDPPTIQDFTGFNHAHLLYQPQTENIINGGTASHGFITPSCFTDTSYYPPPPTPCLSNPLIYTNLPACFFGNGGGDNRGETSSGEGIICQDHGDEREKGVMGLKERRGEGGGSTKTSERLRRQEFNHKYTALRKLIPNHTKTDRASIVGGAIEYIKELVQTVSGLKLVTEKRRGGGSGRIKKDNTGGGNTDSSNAKFIDRSDELLSSSRLHRKSKDTEVDVCIIDDEATIKLVHQRKKNNPLLFVSKVLDELQLDLHHIAGGHFGDYCCFIFNTKIYEGSSGVNASTIANKLLEGMDKDNAVYPPLHQPLTTFDQELHHSL